MRCNKSLTPLLGALAMALAGCASRPVPIQSRSDLRVPAEWAISSGTQSVQQRWWEGFNDPMLSALVTEALRNGPDIRLARARLREAKALADAQAGLLWPSVDIAGGDTRSRSISDVALRPYLSTGHQALFQAAYEVDLFGRVDAQVEASNSAARGANFSHDATELSIAGAVASAYMGLLSLDAQLSLAERTLETRHRSLELTRSRESRGYASALEAAQAEAELRAAELVIPQQRMAIKRQEGVINVLLGRSPGAVERGAGFEALRPQGVPDAGVPSALLERRPDIASAREQVVASDAQFAAARAQLLPSLKLTGSFGRVGSTALRDGPFTIWSLGGSVLAPLFNGGRLRALAAASDARREQALASYERSVLSAFDEVETQLDDHRQLGSLLEAAMAQRNALEDALVIAQRRRREGYASYLDELVAQRSLFGAQQAVIQYRASLLQNEVALFRALGGGWTGAGDV